MAGLCGTWFPSAMHDGEGRFGSCSWSSLPVFAEFLSAVVVTSRSDSIEGRRVDDLRIQEPLAGRVVEEDAVLLRFPNGRESHGTRTVQAVANPAGSAALQEKPLGHLKSPVLKLVVRAKNLAHIVADVIETAKLQNARNHLG
jgi:hypothetical protein